MGNMLFSIPNAKTALGLTAQAESGETVTQENSTGETESNLNQGRGGDKCQSQPIKKRTTLARVRRTCESRWNSTLSMSPTSSNPLSESGHTLVFVSLIGNS